MLKSRIEFARTLAKGKRVLDIGGKKCPPPIGVTAKPYQRYEMAYAEIGKAAKEYRIVDFQRDPAVDYVIDFNNPGSIDELRKVIIDFKPDVILCMELLEHVNYHFELINELASWVNRGVEVFLSLPNSRHWLYSSFGGWLIKLDMNWQHCVLFDRNVAKRFVERSNMSKYNVVFMPCMERYLWYWWLIYILGFCQPVNFGFYVTTNKI